jgi:uncharacterized membrane protein
MIHKISARREKQLVNAARKKLRKSGAVNRAAAKQVKIQVVAPWKRVVVGLFGCVWLGIAYFVRDDSLLASLCFGVLFVLTVIFALLGSKKTIEGALNGLDASVTNRVLDSIFDQIF